MVISLKRGFAVDHIIIGALPLPSAELTCQTSSHGKTSTSLLNLGKRIYDVGDVTRNNVFVVDVGRRPRYYSGKSGHIACRARRPPLTDLTTRSNRAAIALQLGPQRHYSHY
jgi:hypothetical protein